MNLELTADLLPVSASFGLLIFVLLVLTAMNTTRMRFQVGSGYKEPEGREKIRRASRAHGNTFEHCIPILLMMMFYELQGGSVAVLCILGTALLAVRVLYVGAMLVKPGSIPMQIAAGTTYVIELAWIGLLAAALL